MLADQFGRPLALVEPHIVEDDDIAGLEFWSQLGLDPRLEMAGVHRCIDDPWGDQAMAAQAGDEGLCLPLAKGGMRLVTVAFRRPAGAFGQLGVGRCFVDEDQARQGFAEEGLAPSQP